MLCFVEWVVGLNGQISLVVARSYETSVQERSDTQILHRIHKIIIFPIIFYIFNQLDTVEEQ